MTAAGPWWRIDGEGRAEGPFGPDEMRAALADGTLGLSDPVWSPDAAEWLPFDAGFPHDAGTGPRPPVAAFLVSVAAFAVAASGVVVGLFSNGIWDGAALPPISTLYLIYGGLTLAVGAATIAMTWFGRRSARLLRHRPRARRTLRVATVGLFSLGFVFTLLQGIATTVVPEDVTEVAEYHFTVTRGSGPDRIVIDGDVGFGFARTVREALDAMPDPVRIEITSGGGLVAEALKVAAAVEKRPGAVVVARRTCESACTVVLMAGTQRLADQDMQIGFHALSLVEAEEKRGKIFGFDLPVAIARHFGGDDYLERRGVPAEIVAEANRRGHEGMYEVPAEMLLARGALTGLVDPLPEEATEADPAAPD